VLSFEEGRQASSVYDGTALTTRTAPVHVAYASWCGLWHNRDWMVAEDGAA